MPDFKRRRILMRDRRLDSLAALIAHGVGNAAWIGTGEPSPRGGISQDALHAAEGPRADELDFMAERFETSSHGFLAAILHA